MSPREKIGLVVEVDKVDKVVTQRKGPTMSKAMVASSGTAGLLADEREFLNELSEPLRKHRSYGAAKLAELVVRAFTMTVAEAGKPARAEKLSLATLRGLEARQRLAEAEGGSLSSDEAARLLGISKTAVLKRLEAGRLLAWREERLKAARFPRWQFDDRGKVLNGLGEVLEILNANPRLDSWAKVLFFLQNKPGLDDLRPLDLLRKGRITEVNQAANAYAG